jgi:hypothetical protein
MKKNILIIAAIPMVIFSILTAQAVEENAASSVISAATNAITPAIPELQKNLIITDAWVREPISPNNNSVVYMKISNPTDKEIVIIGSSAAETANNVELHQSFVDEKGVSRMTSIDKIVVPAKTDIELAPTGIHIMLLDLKKSLKIGDKVKLEVKIQGRNPLVIQAEVKNESN